MTEERKPYNRFILFGGDYYYPGGGWNDFIGSFDTIGEMNSYASGINTRYEWMHGIDTETRAKINVGVKTRDYTA